MKKREIQVIVFMIMLSRSLERILDTMCYAGYIYDYAHSFFGEDF